MLAQRVESATDKALTVSEERVEVDVGTDARPTSRLVFPPIPRLLDNESPLARDDQASKLLRSDVTVTTGRDETLWERAEAELARLLSRYQDYRDSPTYLAKASRLALACGRPDAAHQLASEAVQLGDSGLGSRYRLAETLIQSAEYDEASRVLVELTNSGHLLSCLRLCELSIRSADYDTANHWLTRAEEIEEDDWRVQMIAGTMALITGAFDQAVRHFRNSLGARPRSVRLHYDLAFAHVLNGHFKNAMTAFRKAVALGPFQKRTLVAWADLSVHLGNGLDEVADALSRYLLLDPHDKPTIGRLASILREQGELAASYQLLSDSRRHSTGDPELSNNMGVLAAERKDLRLAIQQFSKAVVQASDAGNDGDERLRSVATANLMGSLIEARSFAEATRVAKAFVDSVSLPQLLNGDPEYRIADGLIEALMESGRFQSAVDLAERWIGSTTVDSRLEVFLAEKLVCYYTLEMVDREKAYTFAKRAYDVQSRIEPVDIIRYQGTINNLAFALIEFGDYDAAAPYLARLQPLADANGAFAHATRGLYAIRVGRLEKGERLYRRAISHADQRLKNQLRKKLQWELAAYWRDNGDKRKSRAHLAKVLDIESDSCWKLRHLDRRAKRMLRRSEKTKSHASSKSQG